MYLKTVQVLAIVRISKHKNRIGLKSGLDAFIDCSHFLDKQLRSVSRTTSTNFVT